MAKEHIPNAETRKAIEQCEKGIGLKTVNTVEQLFKELNGKEKDCINCEEWIEGPLADCSKCNKNERDKNGRVIENDD